MDGSGADKQAITLLAPSSGVSGLMLKLPDSCVFKMKILTLTVHYVTSSFKLPIQSQLGTNESLEL